MVSIRSTVLLTLVVGAAVRASTVLTEDEQKSYSDAFVRQQKQTKTFQADLKQTLRLRGLKRPVESEGRLSYRAPDSLLIKFTQPAGEYLLIKGDDVYLKKANRPLTHRTSTPGRTGPGQEMRFLLSLFQNGVAEFANEFNVQMSRTDGQLLVSLLPKKPDPRFPMSAIENVMELPSLEIRATKVNFDADNSVSYEFLNPRRNEPLDATLFEPPAADRKL